MLPIPSEVQVQFEAQLGKRSVPNGLHGLYKKWLRYYLDFCQKYHFPPAHSQSLPRFIQKLNEKKQTSAQQEQAANAIRIYYDTLPAKSPSKPRVLIQPSDPQKKDTPHGRERFSIREPGAGPFQDRRGSTLVSPTLPISVPARSLPKAGLLGEKKTAESGICSPG